MEGAAGMLNRAKGLTEGWPSHWGSGVKSFALARTLRCDAITA